MACAPSIVTPHMAPHHSSLALLALVAACVPAGAVSGIATPGCVSSTSGVTDYYPIKVSITDLPATTTTVLNATTVRPEHRHAMSF